MSDPVQADDIAPGDMVRVSAQGRLFHAIVRGAIVGGLEVEPVERGVSVRRVKARDVVEHWACTRGIRAASVKDRQQRSFDDLLDR